MPSIDRRTLLIGGGVGVGLVVAWALWPGGLESELATRPGEQSFGPYIKIARDGRVTVAVPQVETGQGIWTALPQVVADELGAAWETVAVEPAPLAPAYANPMAKAEGWLDGFGFLKAHQLTAHGGMRITAGSTSIRAFETPMRLAAATARAMLIDAAADRWDVDPSACVAADGFVISGSQTATFGELAEEAAGRSPPGTTALRTGGKARLIGQPLQRLDGPGKANGSVRFASDVRLPDMLFASARLAPDGARLLSFDRRAIEASAGVRHVSARERWLAVVADDWHSAEQALAKANARFEGPSFNGAARPLFDAAMASGTSDRIIAQGDYARAVAGRRPVAASYFVAPSQHLWIEPIAAAARWVDGRPELWAGTQAPGLLADQAGGSLYPLPVGGPSGRAIECPAAAIAIALARAIKRPVQLILPHHLCQNVGPVSPGALASMSALPREDGIPAAWRARIVTGNGLSASLARLGGAESEARLNPQALRGAAPPYAIEHLAVDGIAAHLPYATGYMRGSPERELTFFTESFVDELARRKGVEPLAFRMTMLGRDPRLARCFQAAATLANWDGGGPGSCMGIAGASAYGSSIALVASASIGPDQRVSVQRLVAAVDCGPVVNSSLAEQQIEAGLMWALAQATIEAPEWVSGFARARSFAATALPRIGGGPEIIIRFLPSSAAAGGLSGLGTLPLAPAVANAIHAAAGKRMRSLPFDPMGAA